MMKNPGGEPDIQARTFDFSVRVVRLCQELMKNYGVGSIMGKQLLRCGTSIGANVEEAQGAQAKRDFISKMSISHKESRETVYWIRLLVATDVMIEARLSPLRDEAERIARIIAQIIISARRGKDDEPSDDDKD
jgi:four helix bundle protein